MAGDLHRRRADTVLFVNGIPLVLMEFKDPNRPVRAAYDENLTDYRDTVPQLFVPNGFVLLSNGSKAKVGSTYSPWEFFGDWKVIDADGTTRRRRAGDGDPRHLRARPAARPDRELRRLHRAARRADQGRGPQPSGAGRQRGDREAVQGPGGRRQAARGVLAHAGLAASRCRCCGSPRRCCGASPAPGPSSWSPTAPSWTCRLHGEFADAGAISREATGARVSSAANLRELLAADHRYVFTLIHKFRLDRPPARRPCRCCRTARTSSSSPTRRTAASTTRWR